MIILENLAERFPEVRIISGDESRAENKSVSSAADYPPPESRGFRKKSFCFVPACNKRVSKRGRAICMRAPASGDSITSDSREPDHLTFGDGEATFSEYSIPIVPSLRGREMLLCKKRENDSKWDKVFHLYRFTKGAR